MRWLALACLVACDTGGGVVPGTDLGAVDQRAVDATDESFSDAADESFHDVLDSQIDGPVDAGLGTDLAAPDGSPPDAEMAARLRVATWNIHCLLDDWPARVERLAETLAQVDPDVILVQEVCREGATDGLSDLVTALTVRTGRRYQQEWARTHLAWDRYDEGIALVSAYPMRASVMDLPPGLFPRKAIRAEVDSPLGPVTVAVTHLSFGDQADVRRAQMETLVAALPERVILGGDLNQAPDEGPIAASGLTDAWATVNPDDAGWTYPAGELRARIDYILSRGWVPISARRLGVAPVPSDHLGLVVDLVSE